MTFITEVDETFIESNQEICYEPGLSYFHSKNCNDGKCVPLQRSLTRNNLDNIYSTMKDGGPNPGDVVCERAGGMLMPVSFEAVGTTFDGSVCVYYTDDEVPEMSFVSAYGYLTETENSLGGFEGAPVYPTPDLSNATIDIECAIEDMECQKRTLIPNACPGGMKPIEYAVDQPDEACVKKDEDGNSQEYWYDRLPPIPSEKTVADLKALVKTPPTGKSRYLAEFHDRTSPSGSMPGAVASFGTPHTCWANVAVLCEGVKIQNSWWGEAPVFQMPAEVSEVSPEHIDYSAKDQTCRDILTSGSYSSEQFSLCFGYCNTVCEGLMPDHSEFSDPIRNPLAGYSPMIAELPDSSGQLMGWPSSTTSYGVCHFNCKQTYAN